MFNQQPFLLFMMLAAYYGSILPRVNTLQPFSPRYRPFDMIFLDDEDIYDGDFGTGIDFIPRLKERSLNLTSDLKVNDSKSSTKFEKSPESSIYDDSKMSIREHSPKPEKPLLDIKINYVDDLGTVSTEAPTVFTTTDNTVSKNTKSMEDVPDEFIKGFFNSITCMIQGIIEILFGPLPPKTNKSKEIVGLTEKDFTPIRKVHKREIVDSDTTINSTNNTDLNHEHSVQSSSELFWFSNNTDSVNTESTLNSSEGLESSVQTLLSKTHFIDEGIQQTSDKSNLGDNSSSIAHIDNVTEHNNVKHDPESTSDKLTSFSKVTFVTHAKENHLVKKKPAMLLDDPFTTQDDPELLDDAVKIADYDDRANDKSGNSNVLKSSSVGEVVLVTSACVFFVLIFATGGAALAYAVRKKQLVGNPFGNHMASSQYNPNLANA